MAAKKTAKKTASKTAKKAAKRAAKKTAKKVAKKVTKKAAKKTAKKAAEKTAKKSAKTASSVIGEGAMVADREVQLVDEAVRLSSLMGEKGMVLYFYPKDSTPGCTQEACDFRDSSESLQRLGYSVVGVSPDSPQSHRRFAEKQGLNFPLISDAEQKLCQDFGVWAEKKLYGRTYMGVIRSTFILDRSLRVRKVFSPVRVSGHSTEVLQAIPSILNQ